MGDGNVVSRLLLELFKEARDVRLAFKTLRIVLRNVVEKGKDEHDAKFRTLKLTNERLTARLLQYPAAKSLLNHLGFTEDADSESLVLALDFDPSPISSALDMVKAEEERLKEVTLPTPVAEPRLKRPKLESANANEKSEALPQVENTVAEEKAKDLTVVYCDACNKARRLTNEERDSFDLGPDSTWVCSMLSRLKANGDCDVPDDEVTAITGDRCALALQRTGVNTRAELAKANPEDFDAGPYAPHLRLWVLKAQQEELFDIRAEVFGPLRPQLIENLYYVGVNSPKDILDHDATEFAELFADRLGPNGPTPEEVKEWQARAKVKVEEAPWLEDWQYSYFLDAEAESAAASAGAASSSSAPPVLTLKSEGSTAASRVDASQDRNEAESVPSEEHVSNRVKEEPNVPNGTVKVTSASDAESKETSQPST